MEQIDFFKIEDTLSNNAINQVFKSPEAIYSLSRTLSKLTAFLIFPSKITLLLVSTAILEIIPLGKLAAQKGIEAHLDLCEILRNTKTYQECKEEYEQFIKELAIMIKQKGFTSSKEICNYLENIICLSHLSICNHNEYHKDIYSKECSIPELYGAKVLSGYHICRHYSSIIADVLTELNYEACNVAVRPTKDNPISVLRLKLRENHSVVGVYENGYKYYFDPTTNAFGVKDERIPEKNSYRISKMLSWQAEGYYIAQKPTFSLNLNKEELQRKIHQAPFMTMTEEELEKIKVKTIIEAFDKDYEMLLEFKKRNLERMKKICELYQELMPSQDKPIKKWLVRK